MKIEYKILWLDDQIDEFIDDEFVDQIKEYLIEEGFEPRIQTISKPEDLFGNLSEDWDLILTDYNMAGKNGAEVIKEIREKSIFTEILFYTAQQQWEDVYNTPRFSDRHNYGGMTRNRYICKKEENQNGKTI